MTLRIERPARDDVARERPTTGDRKPLTAVKSDGANESVATDVSKASTRASWKTPNR